MIKAKEFLLKNIRNYVKLGITNNLGKVEEFDDKLVCYVDDRYKEKNCFKASESTKYFFHCGVLEKNINLILNTFDNKFDKETKMLGLLEEGKKLFIEKSVKMYNSTTKAPFFKTIFL